MAEVEYTGTAPWFHIWHGNSQRRHYLNNLADLLGLVEDRHLHRLAGREISPVDAEAIRRAVVWVGSDGRLHVDNWSSRWLKKKHVSVVVQMAIDAHDSLPHVPRPPSWQVRPQDHQSTQ